MQGPNWQLKWVYDGDQHLCMPLDCFKGGKTRMS